MDLNLLNVLDALLEEGSVMGAAERLHLSSPAVSRALGRLRKATGDDILVRTGHTMTPTPYALAIREDAHRLVRQARGSWPRPPWTTTICGTAGSTSNWAEGERVCPNSGPRRWATIPSSWSCGPATRARTLSICRPMRHSRTYWCPGAAV